MFAKMPLKLFLDINGTVIAQDTARGKENLLLRILAISKMEVYT